MQAEHAALRARQAAWEREYAALAGAHAASHAEHAASEGEQAALQALQAALHALQASWCAEQAALHGGRAALQPPPSAPTRQDAALAGADAALLRYGCGMDYFIGHLVERSGLQPRTIRSYIALRIIPPPTGNGPAALYGEEHLQRLVAAARMRAAGDSLQEVAAKLAAMSLAQVRAYVRKTEPGPGSGPLSSSVRDPVPTEPAPPPAATPASSEPPRSTASR